MLVIITLLYSYLVVFKLQDSHWKSFPSILWLKMCYGVSLRNLPIFGRYVKVTLTIEKVISQSFLLFYLVNIQVGVDSATIANSGIA